MEYVNLGRSGLKISKVILGCMSYGTSGWQEWVLDEHQALPLLEYAYKRGINTWNTADTSSNGQSEALISKALGCLTECFAGVNDEGRQTQISDSIVNDGPWVNRVGLSRKHIFDAVDAGVQRLGSYIDEIMRVLNDVIESGKVRYIGASSMAAWEFQALQNIAVRNNWHRFISMQNYHNLLAREEEQEMFPYCIDAGIGLDSLVAARTRVRDVTDRAVRSLVRGEFDGDQKIVDHVEEVAAKKGVSMAQVATAWSLSHHGMNLILGLNSKERDRRGGYSYPD
ncbi:NADP-dependent oxidoreductase domain-containing protein [Talaromyces proteolyticus]|uniref:NADP-dependent oxidoreductase domain-containing protein n=1 Tax=Talaromyces proteolyticus TaxID=1131652 RepID=A0AAD4KSH0_9EURO|nr:NADP-dependent oxidoreductase domain-containing protein [Talaromyces proteolyticus]KAH8698363.1 NADP-dependent oxidoreductase domain-containing protein [Talaromyces proteolyticus]